MTRKFRIDDRVQLKHRPGRRGYVWELRTSGRISVHWDAEPLDSKSYNKRHYHPKSLERIA